MAHHKQACHNRTNKNWANSQSQKPYKGVNKVGAILHRNSTNKIPPLSLGWGTTSISPTSKVSNFGSVLFLIGTTTFTRFDRLGLHPHDTLVKYKIPMPECIDVSQCSFIQYSSFKYPFVHPIPVIYQHPNLFCIYQQYYLFSSTPL